MKFNYGKWRGISTNDPFVDWLIHFSEKCRLVLTFDYFKANFGNFWSKNRRQLSNSQKIREYGKNRGQSCVIQQAASFSGNLKQIFEKFWKNLVNKVSFLTKEEIWILNGKNDMERKLFILSKFERNFSTSKK